MNGYMKSTAVALFSLMLLAGCGQDKTEKLHGLVAIVDLDKIARTLGRDIVMDEKVKKYVQEQQNTINKLREELKKKLQDEEKKLGKKPKKKAKEKYAEMSRQAEFKLRQDIALAEREAKQLRTRLIRAFRSEVEIIAMKIASEDGFSLVFIKQPAMLYIDPTVDISNAVVATMQGSQPKE